MAVENSGPVKTLEAAATITIYQRLKVDTSGKWAVAGVTEKAHAVALAPAAAGAQCPGLLLNCAGTVKMVSAVVLTQGEKVYGAAAGKINDTTTNCLEGIAMEAAAADGDIIEVLVMNTSAVTL
jgi:hypothetical protein